MARFYDGLVDAARQSAPMTPGMDAIVTPAADDQSLAMTCDHHLDPFGLWTRPLRLEVAQGSHVVDLNPDR